MNIYIKILILWVLCCLSTLTFGQEGNYKLENYGNHSALLTGNVTASITDLGLTYYNPSKLSFHEESSFLVSIKAYQWDQFSYNNDFGDGNQISDSEFNGIPSMIAGEFHVKFLPDHKFAYSLISRYRTTSNLVYESGIVDNDVGQIGDPIASLLNINLQSRIKDEWMGLTWAYKISENFGVGVSTFLSIYQFKENGELLISEQKENDEVSLLSSRLNFKQNTYGLFFKIGMTYNISDIELGANISLPYFGIKDNASVLVQKLAAGYGPEDDSFKFSNEKNLNNHRKTALGIAVGAGIPLGKSKLHLNAEWYSKISEYERISLPSNVLDDRTTQSKFNEEFKSVLNFGAGADVFLSPKATLILSVSSDFSAHVSSLSLLDVYQKIDNVNVYGDFWHLGIGTDLALKWGNIYTGIVYSKTAAEIKESSDTNPLYLDLLSDGALEGIKYQRVRLIVGIDLPVFNQLEKKLEKALRK